MSDPKFIELNVSSTAFGGKGVARHDSKVYFVEDAIEGDFVRAEITDAGDRYSSARAMDILTPSPWRGPSPCAFSDRCGGCQWQGVPYEKQLEWKKDFVVSALKRIGKLGDHVPCEMLGSPNTQAYRNRIMVRARIQADGRIVVGYFQRGSRNFVEIDQCKIASPRLNAFIQQVTSLCIPNKTNGEIKFRFEMQDLPSKQGHEGHLLLSIYDPDDKGLTADDLAQYFAKLPSVLWAGAIRSLPEAPFIPLETDMGITFHTAAGLFQQVNIPHNHMIRRLVRSVVERLQPLTILDIFCGSGNLSLPLANGERTIRGVEFSKRAIECAKHNCAQNKIAGAEYFAGDTEKFLWRASKAQEQYDLVIADPPREGMYKALIPLKNMRPKHIIYVSCDPTTLARDLGSLCKSGYKIIELKALDFFPNTYHVESFVVLELEPRTP